VRSVITVRVRVTGDDDIVDGKITGGGDGIFPTSGEIFALRSFAMMMMIRMMMMLEDGCDAYHQS